MKMGQTLGLSMNLHYPFSLYSVSTKWYKKKTLINTHHADKKKRMKKKEGIRNHTKRKRRAGARYTRGFVYTIHMHKQMKPKNAPLPNRYSYRTQIIKRVVLHLRSLVSINRSARPCL